MKKKINHSFIFLVVFIVFVIAIVGSLVLYINIRYPLKYQEYITKYSEEYKLDKNIVASLINEESSFRPNAVSKKGAMGLMQLSPDTARFVAQKLGEEYDGNAIFKIDTNIRYGCYYLGYLRDKFVDLTTYLSAYNAGETTVKLWKKDETNGLTLSSIPYPVTREYVSRIISGVKVYKGRF